MNFMEFINWLEQLFEMKKYLTWNLGVLILLIFSAYFSFKISQNDDVKKKDIEDKTNLLVNTGKETIDNLNKVSKDVSNSQKQAKLTYDKLEKTYVNTIENIEKSELNYKINLKNLERTLEAKNSILESQKEIINQLTGGNSFPYFTITNKRLKININGKYSIPNLHFEIYFLKNYQLIDVNEENRYITQRQLNSNFQMLFNQNIGKLFQNTNYEQFEIPENVLQSISNDNSSGFDVFFTSDFKRWSQHIRLNKNALNNDILEISNVIYELKNTKSENPFESSFRIKTQSSVNYNLGTEIYKTITNAPLDHLIIIYRSQKLDLKSSEIEKSLNPYTIDEFK